MLLPIIISCVIACAVTMTLVLLIQRVRHDSASRSAEKIRSDAEREAEHLLRDARVSAKGETIKMREECEAELKERRREQSNVEKRLAQREELLDRRADSMDAKLKNIEKQEADIATLRERLSTREQELNKNISRQIDELERISGYSREEAREVLLEKLFECCHGFGMKCLAEGVETEEQLKLIRKVGVDLIQGYYYAKPMPDADFEKKYL